MSSRAEVGDAIAAVMQEVIASAVMTNERIARSFGLNVIDLQAYGVLVRNSGPMTPSELSAATELPSSTTTRVLDRLAAKGLVERVPDPEDRRKVWLHPQPIESAKVGEAYAEIGRQLEAVHAGFTVAELRTALKYLTAVKGVS